MSYRDWGRSERDDGDKRSDDAVPVDEAVDARQGAHGVDGRDGTWTRCQGARNDASKRATSARWWHDDGGTTAGVVAREGGIYRRGGVAMPSGGATTAAARGEA